MADNTRVPLREETNPHTGKMRLRCTHHRCGKVAYATQAIAAAAARKILAHGGQEMLPYYGEKCGWWHVRRKRESE